MGNICKSIVPQLGKRGQSGFQRNFPAMGNRPKSAPNRIKELRRQKKLTQDRLAEIVGCSKQQIVKLERGERGLSQRWMEKIAGALGVGAHMLLPMPANLDVMVTTRVIVCGAVQAGHYKEAIEWPLADHYAIEVPVSGAYRGCAVFGVRVDGPSMNLEFPEGAVAVCVRVADLGANYVPESSRFYVVYRVDAADRIEATIKQFRLDADGQGWLWPRSSHPDHQSPIRITGQNGERVTLHARVIGSYTPK